MEGGGIAIGLFGLDLPPLPKYPPERNWPRCMLKADDDDAACGQQPILYNSQDEHADTYSKDDVPAFVDKTRPPAPFGQEINVDSYSTYDFVAPKKPHKAHLSSN